MVITEVIAKSLRTPP